MYVTAPEPRTLSEPAVFKLFLENGDKYAWTAKVAKDEETGDLLFYDLERLKEH